MVRVRAEKGQGLGDCLRLAQNPGVQPLALAKHPVRARSAAEMGCTLR